MAKRTGNYKWQQLSKKVVKRDGGQCAYCPTNTLTPGAVMGADHIIPVAVWPEGEFIESNCICCCQKCNGRKQDRLLIRTTWVDPKYVSVLGTAGQVQLSGSYA